MSKIKSENIDVDWKLLDSIKVEVKNELCIIENEPFPEESQQKEAYVCKECNRLFFTYLSYKDHHTDYHSGINKDIKSTMLVYEHQVQTIKEEYEIQSVESPKLPSPKRKSQLPFCCKFCEKSFSKKQVLLNHLNYVHRPPKYQCDICELKLPEKRTLRNHLLAIHIKQKVKCLLCNNQLSTLSFRRHLQYKHKKTLAEYNELRNSCDLIKIKKLKQKFDNLKDYQVKCKICQKAFRTEANVKEHMDRVHKPPKFECDLCKKKFSTKPSLSSHMMSVHLRLKEVCTICNKTYSKCAIRKHIPLCKFKLRSIEK